MSAHQKIYSAEAKQELNTLYKASKNAGEQKRLLCIKLRVVNCKKAKEISEITGYTIGTVQDMISSYNKKGIAQFLYKKRPGNHRKLPISDEQELLSTFEETAENGSILVVSDIHKAYETKAGTTVSLATVYNMLHRNGWRKIMPRSKHPQKANDEAIEAYKKNQ